VPSLSDLTSATRLKLAEARLEVGADDTLYGFDNLDDFHAPVPQYTNSDDTSDEEGDESIHHQTERSHEGEAIDNAQ
jgi:hypothetical protein